MANYTNHERPNVSTALNALTAACAPIMEALDHIHQRMEIHKPIDIEMVRKLIDSAAIKTGVAALSWRNVDDANGMLFGK